jgi:hypothetical protein
LRRRLRPKLGGGAKERERERERERVFKNTCINKNTRVYPKVPGLAAWGLLL